MQLVERIFMVLELLSNKPEGLMITEISKSLDLPVSTTHRLLASLKDNDYVLQDKETSRYRLGLKVVSLAVGYLNNNNVKTVARPFLEDLFNKYEEVIFLTVMENKKSICIDTVNSGDRIKFYVKIGSEMPLNGASAAQAIVAYLEEKEIDEILEKSEFKRYSKNTLTDCLEVKEKLSKIREAGYAVCDEELDDGVIAISTDRKSVV